MSTMACDMCRRPIRTATLASVFLDSVSVAVCAVIAHDQCVPELIARPGRFRWVSVSDLERVGDMSDPYRVQPSLASKLAHYREKEWFNEQHERALQRGHILADMLGAERRRPSRSGIRRPIPLALRTRVLERDGFKCRRCGVSSDEAKLVMDHVVPVAKGGRTDFANLQSLCAECNSGKSDSHPTPRDLEVTQ